MAVELLVEVDKVGRKTSASTIGYNACIYMPLLTSVLLVKLTMNGIFYSAEIARRALY
jgi:hypothetical protein